MVSDDSTSEEDLDQPVVSQVRKVALTTFPRHWDTLPIQHVTTTGISHKFSDAFASLHLQAEYWWRKTKPAYDGFKTQWLKHFGLEDDRHELTEYQLVREILWVLLGARSSFIFCVFYHPHKLFANRFSPASRVSLANMAYPTLDSLLILFGRFASLTLLLRTFVQFIENTAASLHPCLVAFGTCLGDYLGEFDQVLQTLETEARGPETFTLTTLYFKLLLWDRRTDILANLVSRLTAGHTSSLQEANVHIRLLNLLYYVANTFGDCSSDVSFLDTLNTFFFRTFLPFMYTTVQLLSGCASMLEYSHSLFPNAKDSCAVTDPDFCQRAFFGEPTAINSLISSNGDQVPEIFHSVLDELLSGLKSLCILTALAAGASQSSVLGPIVLKTEDIFVHLTAPVVQPQKSHATNGRIIHNDDHIASVKSWVEPDILSLRQELIDSVRTPVAQETRPGHTSFSEFTRNNDHLNLLQKNLKRFIVERSRTLNQHLMRMLLEPSPVQFGSHRSLGTALAAVGAVYLFGTGDRVNDFSRQLFSHIFNSEPWYRDLVGLTLRLRSQFETHLVPKFLYREISMFTFASISQSDLGGSTAVEQTLRCFSLVHLTYCTTWPVNIVLTESNLTTYNSIFTFMLKIKYAKWSLETLRFPQLDYLSSIDPDTYHRMLLLRLNMLYIFTGLHDFLMHRIEALRVKFAQHWRLPGCSLTPASDTGSAVPYGDLPELIQSHNVLLHTLQSVCLLTESSSMLRTEIDNICQMAFTLKILWSPSHSRPLDLAPRLTQLASLFHNHVKFLARLFYGSVRLSNVKRLLPLAETFRLASNFTSRIRNSEHDSRTSEHSKDDDGTLAPLPSVTNNVATRFASRPSQSLRHSLGRLSLRGRAVWTSQRTSKLFELLTRPALLFTPSRGIRLPFALKKSDGDGARSHRLSIRKRNQPIDPDPCLLSLDGLLDCLYAMSNLVDQVYYDCKENEDDQTETHSYDHSPTLLAANFFRKRVKPALTRLNEMRVQLSDFKLGKFIGRGACGVVRVVHEVAPPGSVYAMKSQYKGAWLHHDPEGSQLMLERTVLAQAAAIENPWLPHLHYAFQDEKHLHLVMDYEPGGDLYIFLSKVGHLLDAEMIAFYAAEAIEAIHSLHRMGYIHCDLKPENFAIERSGHLKLLDFGSAIRLDADGKCVCPTMVGTKEYLNIELLRQRGRHNEEPLLVGPEYDYWAIGVLLYELFYSQTPFYDKDEDLMMQKIVDYKKTLKFPSNVQIPDNAVQLIRSLITSPSKRLTYDGCVRHSFFKTIDFTTLRQTTPPYLPPVGELDDVSNFSGGGSRTRDELIMDVSTNETFSPIRMKETARESLHPSVVDTTCNLAEAAEVTLLTQERTHPSDGVDEKMFDENTDPMVNESHAVDDKLETPLNNREAKVKAIREAAAISIPEEFEEIEDVEWDGSDCVRNLPFVGYTFTPGLVLLRKLTSGQAAAVAAAGLGTAMLNVTNTTLPLTRQQTMRTTTSHLQLLNATVTEAVNTTGPYLNITENPPLELCGKWSELRQLCDVLENHARSLEPEHSEHLQTLRKRLIDAIEDSSNLVAFGDAITAWIAQEKYTFEVLERLRNENACLQRTNQANQSYRAQLEKVRLVLSRLDSLPNDFVEIDLSELLRTMCPNTPATPYSTGTDDCTKTSQSDADLLVQQIIGLVQKQLKQFRCREDECRAALEAANRERKEIWEASLQQMGTLDTMVADQRQLRACETNLKREIQELRQKLLNEKDYQRDLRNQCLQYEDKYFSIRDRLEEEKKRCSDMQAQLRELTMNKDAAEALLRETNLKLDRLQHSQDNAVIDHLRSELELVKTQLQRSEIDRTSAEQREQTVRDQLSDCERQLDNSRHEANLLRDRYERMKEATAELEACLLRHPVRDDRSEVTALRRQLVESTDQIHSLKGEVFQLQTQLERLRVNNTQLVNQRDEATEQVRLLNDALSQEKELVEVTQQASENEIFRLNTITKQQGKLIDHMCGLLPPEHQLPMRRLANAGRSGLVHDPSVLFGTKRSNVKALGHHAFKTSGRRSRKPGPDESDPSSSGAGPLIAAASAFFGRRRPTGPGKSERILSETDDKSSGPHPFTKQPSRLQRIVRKSRLRFKRRTCVQSRPTEPAAIESDQVFTEDEDGDEQFGYYSPDPASDFDSDLPYRSVPFQGERVAAATPQSGGTADPLSYEDSISSGPSTTSSAPSGQIIESNPKSSFWRPQRSKLRVGWAEGSREAELISATPTEKQRPKLLKQLSKVLVVRRLVPVSLDIFEFLYFSPT
ncbi:kinase domain protein [Opisthorchis viverrini]|uniref:non-specific serine/threonine protein kinase n=1 Tax=Opisthorchis viverrini TaxID=6198 RepID=A0A1S8XA32_OPIVI|nr:kinase domain protein [Opisthorchis viverrini]